MNLNKYSLRESTIQSKLGPLLLLIGKILVKCLSEQNEDHRELQVSVRIDHNKVFLRMALELEEDKWMMGKTILEAFNPFLT